MSSPHKASHFGYFSFPSKQWAGKCSQSQSGAAGDPAELNARRQWKHCHPWADKPGFPSPWADKPGFSAATGAWPAGEMLAHPSSRALSWGSRSWDALGPRVSVAVPAAGSDAGKGRAIPSRQQLLHIHQCAWESIPLPHRAQVMKGWQEASASVECLRRGPGCSEEERTQIYSQREGGGQTLPGP